MKIRLLAVSIVFVLIGRVLVFAQSGNALVSLITPTEPVQAGDTFTLTIQVGGAAGVYGSSIRLIYDPLALEPMVSDAGAVTPGDFFGGQPGFTLKNAADLVGGSIEYAMTLRQPAEPITGSGTLGIVQLRALRDGAAQITIAEASLLAPRFEEINGRRIARAVDEVPVDVQGATINVSGSGSQTVIQATPVATQADVVAQIPQSAPAIAPQTVPASLPSLVQPMPGPSPVVVAGIVFFMAGLLLFTMGVGSYVRLRRHFSWQDQI